MGINTKAMRKLTIDNKLYYYLDDGNRLTVITEHPGEKKKVYKFAAEYLKKVVHGNCQETCWVSNRNPGEVRFIIDKLIIGPNKKKNGAPRNKNSNKKHRDDPVVGKFFRFRNVITGNDMPGVRRVIDCGAEHPFGFYWLDYNNRLVLVSIGRTTSEHVYKFLTHDDEHNTKIISVALFPNVKFKSIFHRMDLSEKS